MKISKILIRKVKEAIAYSYSPYSKIQVGAVLYCKNGKMYTGVNIENSSYSLTVCAERVALFKALSEGAKDFVLLLIYSPQYDFITPCGACLQVISEFAPELIVATMSKDEEFKFLPVQTLLKMPFRIKT